MNLRALAATVSLTVVLASSPAQAQSGQVESIDGSSAFLGVRGVVVAPVDRSQPATLVDGGTLDTDGYSRVSLNFAGRASAEPGFRGGAVGAILVPDVEPFITAFRTMGILPSAIEISASADRASGTFMAKQVSFDVGFPRYRVLFFNSTTQSATVHFFAYRHRDE